MFIDGDIHIHIHIITVHVCKNHMVLLKQMHMTFLIMMHVYGPSKSLKNIALLKVLLCA